MRYKVYFHKMGDFSKRVRCVLKTPQLVTSGVRLIVSSVIIGARNESQLGDNLGALGWTLTGDQIARLDAASAITAPYPHFPYRRQEGFARLDPPMV